VSIIGERSGSSILRSVLCCMCVATGTKNKGFGESGGSLLSYLLNYLLTYLVT
jgi:hypothetical protein